MLLYDSSMLPISALPFTFLFLFSRSCRFGRHVYTGNTYIVTIAVAIDANICNRGCALVSLATTFHTLWRG